MKKITKKIFITIGVILTIPMILHLLLIGMDTLTFFKYKVLEEISFYLIEHNLLAISTSLLIWGLIIFLIGFIPEEDK